MTECKFILFFIVLPFVFVAAVIYSEISDMNACSAKGGVPVDNGNVCLAKEAVK